MKSCDRAYHNAVRATLLAAGLFWLAAGAAQAAPATALNCDGCVGSRDIKNRGVRTYDIDVGAVITSRLAPDAVTEGKIADGAVTDGKIAEDAVTAAKIADGAVGAAKLGLARTIYLEDSGSDTVNCDNLRGALEALVGPAALVLGPGTFDCQRHNILLPNQVSLIGSGQNLTTITGSESGASGLVRLGNDAALTDLTVINDDHAGPVSGLTAVFVGDADDWRLSNVTVKAIDGYVQSTAIWVRHGPCSGEMTNVTAIAEGFSDSTGLFISCDDGSISASNVNARAVGSRGASLLKLGESIFTARNSSFGGLNIDIPVGSGSYETLKLISSEVSGDLPDGAICVGVYDETGTALSNGTAGLGGCL